MEILSSLAIGFSAAFQPINLIPLVIVDQALAGQIQGMEFIEMIQSRLPWITSILTSDYLIDSSD